MPKGPKGKYKPHSIKTYTISINIEKPVPLLQIQGAGPEGLSPESLTGDLNRGNEVTGNLAGEHKAVVNEAGFILHVKLDAIYTNQALIQRNFQVMVNTLVHLDKRIARLAKKLGINEAEEENTGKIVPASSFTVR